VTAAPQPDARIEWVRRLAARSAPMAPRPVGIEPRTPALRGIRAVLFDVYGTLLISGAGDIGLSLDAVRADAMAGAFEAAGLGRLDDEPARRAAERFAALIRRRHEERRAAGVDRPEVDIREIWRALLREIGAAPKEDQIGLLAIEYETRVNPAWPVPGAFELVETLAKRNLVLGLVSNAQFYTPLLIEALTGRAPEAWGFARDMCVWSFEEGAAKPSPGLFRAAAERLRRSHGLEPRAALVVGNDAANDVAPAALLGFRTALFAGDARSYRPQPGHAPPDLLLTTLPQIASCLAD